MKNISLFAYLFFVCVCVTAQTKNDSVRVLFIGNSYTYYNNLPETVQKIAATQKIKLSYKANTPGGCTLKKHFLNKEEINDIKQGGWNFVVLQEQSVAPAKPTETVAAETYTYAHKLDSLIHVYNPNAQLIFYMTWGHKDGSLEPVAKYPIVNTYGGMQDRLKTSYLEMAYQNNAGCAPVGMAWQRVRAERPDYLLYLPDRSHPSPLGSYLAANVLFTTMFQRPFQSQYTNGFAPELAEYIQQVAQQTVFNNLELLNLKKK